MKLLLIGPSVYYDDGSIFKKQRILFPRMNLIYLAGLTPKDVEVEIVEELAENIDFETEALSMYKKLYTFKSIVIRSLSQPLRNILRTFLSNIIMRRSIYEV